MKKSKILYCFIISLSLLIICISCNNDKTKNGIQSYPHIGIGPVWRHYQSGTAEDISDMMSKINEVGQMVLAQNNWRDSVAKSGEIPDYFYQLVINWPDYFDVHYNYVSYGINFFNQSNGNADIATITNPENNWTNNPDAKAKYQQVAISLCSDPYYAKYIALALEVNSYCHFNQADYIYFIENVYIPVYDAIKLLDNSIKVFVTFQLEQCKGLGDATVWGYVPDAHWNFLSYYNGKLDLIAFTTYPEFIYANQAEIPDDYYFSIINNLPANLKNKPFAFVEMGWSDKDSNASSQQAQVDFLNRFLMLTDGLNIEYMNWVFMHDMESTPINNKLKLGLRDYEGNARPVWNAWKELKDSN